MKPNERDKRFYKMNWTHHIEQRDIRKTLKHGLIFYIVLGMLTIPSGLCSQSHLVMPAYVVPQANLAEPIDPLPLLETGEQPDLADAQDASASIDNEDEDEAPFNDFILQASQTYEVDPALIRAIIFAESNYDPQAVSHRGAQGLMQLMPKTAKSLGIHDTFDPAMNIDGGVRYFKQLLDRFAGDVRLALAAYNAGSRYVRKYGGVPPFRATKRYIKKVLHYREKFQTEATATQGSASAV